MPSEPFPITATAEPGFPAPGLVSSLSEPAFNPEPVNVTPGADHAGLPDIAYNVRPGDNYWSISKHHYGTVRYFAALGEYNRNRIQDPAHLKPGMKVLVPHPNVLETRYPKLFEGMSPAPQSTGIQPASQQTSDGFFVDADGVPRYRVGKGDTLTDIAQKHLGRASRWTQIHGLNRDLLPTPDRVRPGLVLELPRDASQIAPIP
jgi:nucleoid-associated protein YgaU